MWVSREALDLMRQSFERTLTVLREENSTLRRMLEASQARVDALTLELTKSLVVSPTPPPTVAPSISRRTSKDPIAGLGNLLDPVPVGDPDGLFPSEAAASLMMAEDDDGVSDAA